MKSVRDDAHLQTVLGVRDAQKKPKAAEGEMNKVCLLHQYYAVCGTVAEFEECNFKV
jgi:hypothetical protein